MFDTTVTLQYKEFTVELFDDHAFVEEPADSPTHYDIVHKSANLLEYYCFSRHAIKVYANGLLYKSAILLEAAGATRVSSDGAFLDNDNLIIRCSNQLYSLALPNLEINWVTEADWATCFSIHQFKDSYIVHGELAISRISKQGEILWSYSGADIFVVIDSRGPEFKMNENDIELMDFNGSKYRIDYDGNSLGYEK